MLEDISLSIAKQRIRTEEIKSFGELIISKKPTSEKWSAKDCFLHMCLATELYLDQMEKKLPLLKPENGKYKATFLANYSINSLAPTEDDGIKFKMKTMNKFDPYHADNFSDEDPLDRFLHDLNRLEKIVKACEGKDLRSFKVTTAFGPILRFYLGDALRFICAHNNRHFVQIKNILSQLPVSEVSSAL